MALEKIVLVTQKTRLERLVERFNSSGQARFYIEHAGGDFTDYQLEDETYRRALGQVRRSLDLGLKLQLMDRRFVPTYLFSTRDLIVTVGQDGLVANTAKYVKGQPIVAVNPDPRRFDGILLTCTVPEARGAVLGVLEEKAAVRHVTLAEAELNDGQRLLAFNDFFIGARSHVSARYRLTHNGREESQSSSGILVSTGAGSTGWLSSVFNMASGLALFSGCQSIPARRLEWEDRRLMFVVREPFTSRQSQANLVAGIVEPEAELQVESLMPSGGVLFSDGVENDFLKFDSGSVARVRPAREAAQLVTAA